MLGAEFFTRRPRGVATSPHLRSLFARHVFSGHAKGRIFSGASREPFVNSLFLQQNYCDECYVKFLAHVFPLLTSLIKMTAARTQEPESLTAKPPRRAHGGPDFSRIRRARGRHRDKIRTVPANWLKISRNSRDVRTAPWKQRDKAYRRWSGSSRGQSAARAGAGGGVGVQGG